MKSTDVVVQSQHYIQPANDIGGLMQAAVSGGMSPEGLEKLFSLYERQRDHDAAVAWANAMAEFQADAPVIRKNRSVSAGKYVYTYAELDYIADQIRPLLQRHGLSYRFDSAVTEGAITVKCIVTHSQGHAEATKFTCPTGGMTGANAAQQTASALSYARRYALLLALGLSTGDRDDDAGGGSITPEQVGELTVLIKESGVNRIQFLDWLGVDALEDIPEQKFRRALTALKNRVKK